MANYVGPHSGEPGDIDSTQRNPLGTKIFGDDGSQYVYGLGVASTAAKDAVVFDENFATTRLVTGLVGKVGFASAAIVAAKYGWYCVKSPLGGYTGSSGAAVADNKQLYAHGTAGLVDDAVVSGDMLVGVYSRSAPGSATDIVLEFDNPFCNDVLG